MSWAGFLMAAGLALGAASAGDDVPRQRTEALSSARHEFTIRMEGAVDGVNTRDPITYAAWSQAFEPMRRVRLENIGDTEIVNPWVIVNGKRNWRTVKDIALEAMSAYGDPQKMTGAEKARAIWDFQRQHRFHATTGDFEVRDPVKMYNVYGFSLCGDNAPVLADLWRAAGLRTRRGFPIGHCVSEVWYDGAWHMLDADESVIFLERDNRTIATENKVAHDHDLARRAYPDEMLSSLYPYSGGHGGDYPSHAGHEMRFTLRPGEALEWGWQNAAKHHHAPLPSLYTLGGTDLKKWGPNAWARLSNGKWIYAPDLRKDSGRRYAAVSNIRWSAAAGEPAASAADLSAPATLTWKLAPPYVLVGGAFKARVRTGAKGVFVLQVSRDNANWTEAVRVEGAGTKDINESLDRHFPETGNAAYSYFVRAELRAGAELDAIRFENDLQMAPLSLPALELGDNRILYTDETNEPRAARLIFDWVERSSVKPPKAPAASEYPADGGEAEGTGFAFRWREAEAPLGDKIADYHFQLSDDPSFRWALLPVFDVMISTTPEAGKAEFGLQREGLLNPGQQYYWRVRAKTASGVWGPWSKTWSFVPQAPGVPLNVRLEQDEPDAFTLRWDVNKAGRTPVSFLIYASDEKGFRASDEPYRAPTGNQKERGLFPGERSRIFPANMLAKTTEPAFRLRPRHGFYRVAAIDAKGNRSGSSDLVSAPRPFIYSEPAHEAKVGVPFRYDVKTTRSIGDLTYRDFGPGQSYQSAYWDADRPRFSFETELPRCGTFDPKWLAIDPNTGVVSGTPGPGDVAENQVNVKVEIPGAGVYVQSFPLRVVR